MHDDGREGRPPAGACAATVDAIAACRPMPADAPFPGAMLRNADEFSSDDADAGLVESGAEHEVHTEVTPEQQEKLMQQQDAGADAETGAADDNSTTPSVDLPPHVPESRRSTTASQSTVDVSGSDVDRTILQCVPRCWRVYQAQYLRTPLLARARESMVASPSFWLFQRG